MANAPKKPAPMTNAQRQAAYRQRHLRDPDTVDGARLNLVVAFGAKQQLERLSIHYGVTQREMLAQLLADAENDAINALPAQKRELYYRGLVTR